MEQEHSRVQLVWKRRNERHDRFYRNTLIFCRLFLIIGGILTALNAQRPV